MELELFDVFLHKFGAEETGLECLEISERICFVASSSRTASESLQKFIKKCESCYFSRDLLKISGNYYLPRDSFKEAEVAMIVLP
jgi:hypothetical protein